MASRPMVWVAKTSKTAILTIHRDGDPDFCPAWHLEYMEAQLYHMPGDDEPRYCGIGEPLPEGAIPLSVDDFNALRRLYMSGGL